MYKLRRAIPYLKIWRNPISLYREFQDKQKAWNNYCDENPDVKELRDAPMKPFMALAIQGVIIFYGTYIGILVII